MHGQAMRHPEAEKAFVDRSCDVLAATYGAYLHPAIAAGVVDDDDVAISRSWLGIVREVDGQGALSPFVSLGLQQHKLQ